MDFGEFYKNEVRMLEESLLTGAVHLSCRTRKTTRDVLKVFHFPSCTYNPLRTIVRK